MKWPAIMAGPSFIRVPWQCVNPWFAETFGVSRRKGRSLHIYANIGVSAVQHDAILRICRIAAASG
jgi:hypothetical protein